MAAAERFDFAVVGAGFFGARLALLLGRRGARVALVEREARICARASWTNQARIHNGYHYPRSLSTANGAHRHYERFLREAGPAADEVSSTHLYAIARDGSATSATQFEHFCRQLGLPLLPVPSAKIRLFDPGRVEAVYAVREGAFDARLLRRRLEADLLASPNIALLTGTEVRRVILGDGTAVLETDRDPPLRAGGVFLAAYAGINRILLASGLPPIDTEAELAEICLVEPPPELADLAVTVMDGPFFSLTPLPAERTHALTHVRYTPQARWDLASPPGRRCPYRLAGTLDRRTRFPFMRRDAERFLPALAGLRHQDSRFEVKAIPRRREVDDGRPILVRRHSAEPLCVSVLGSKIDSVFELEEVVEAMLDGSHAGRDG